MAGQGKGRAGARTRAPRLARTVRRGGGTSPDEEGSGADTSLARTGSRNGAESEPAFRVAGMARGRRYRANEHCSASLSEILATSSGGRFPRSPSATVCLPGLGRLAVWAGDRRRHCRLEQIAAPAGIGSVVHRTAGGTHPLDGEVTGRSVVAEPACGGGSRACRPGLVAAAVGLASPPRARSRSEGRRETAARAAGAPQYKGGEVSALGEVDQAGLHCYL